MWDNLGKVKTKRTKPTKPYERPKSILRQVTDSVTGLLPQPSWLVNWLHLSASKDSGESSGKEDEEPVPSTSSSTGSRNVNSSQESTRESFIFQRPPGSLKDQGNGSAPFDLPPARSNLEPASLPPAREVSVQTVNGDDDSHSESTSGCSSLLPHPEHRNREAQDVEPLNIDSSSLQMLRASLSKSFASEMKSNNRPSRKTLSLHPYSHDSSQTAATGNVDSSYNDLEGPSGASFYSKDEMSSTLNQSASKRSILPQPSALNSKRPRFNATMFGPVVMGARRSFLNDTSIADSPFYAGRTTYGGASAYRRASIQPTLTPYPDARKRLQARPSSICSAPPTPTGANAASSSAMSSAAPHVVLSSSAQKILHALEAMSTPVTDAKRIPTTSRRSSSASLQEEEPSFTGYGLSRRRPQLGPPTAKLSMGRPAIVVSRAPTSVSTSTVGTSVLAASTPISSQAGGKMRSRVSATARESIRTVKENEELPETDLPAVALPVSNLPSFSLLPPPPTTSTAVAPPQPSSLSKSTASPCKPPAPSIPCTPAFNGHRAAKEKTEARPTFTFAAPLVTVSPSAAAAAAVAAKTSNSLTFSFSSPLYVRPAATEQLNVEEKKPMEIKTDFPPSPVKPTSELKSGSVMDILRKEAPSKADTPKTSTTTSVAPVGPAPITASVGFGDKFKPPTESWTCSVCCITNSKDKTICAACETPNPKAQKAAPTPAPAAPVAPTSFSGFGDKFKMSSTQWECDTCMVRNLECDTQCKSCETPRPGSAKATAAVKPVSTFKFGVPAPSQEKAALPTPVSAASSAPSSGFSFGTVSDKTDSKKEETSTGGFKFGAAVAVEPAKKSDEAPAGGFKFGASIETPAPTAAPAAVPAAPKTEVSTGGFKFGTSLASAPSAETSGFKFGASAPAVQPSATPSVDTAKKTEPQTSTATTGALQFGVGSTLPPLVDSTKKTESSLGKLLDAPAYSAPSTFGGFGLANTVTTASKTMPVLSFGAAPVQPSKSAEAFEGIKPATELKTGSVLDFLSKKPSLPVSTEASSAPSLSFSQPPKAAPAGMFAFGKPAETSTGTAAPFSFNGPLTSAAGGSTATEEQPTAKKTTFELPAATTTAAVAPSTFSFGATSTPSLSLFKPATTTGATSMFGFGQPSAAATTTSAPSFAGTAVSTTTTSAPAPSLFTFGATTATPAATTSTTTAPAASSTGVFAFGQSAATPASTFPFGAPSAAAPATASAPPAAAPAPVAPSLFQFGKTEPAKSSPFSFGPPAATSAPATSTTSTPFTFGASAAAAPATTQADASKSVFAFGASASQPTATTAAPAFGTFSAPTQAPFGFGAAKTEPFGTPSAPSAPSSTPFGSGFGSAAPTPAAASFGFGSSAQSAAAPMFNPTPSFNFASTATPSAAAPAATAPAANTGIFTFGNAPSMPAMSQGFGTFNAPSFAPANEPPAFGGGFGGNPFDVSASAASSGRKIRKAVRRR